MRDAGVCDQSHPSALRVRARRPAVGTAGRQWPGGLPDRFKKLLVFRSHFSVRFFQRHTKVDVEIFNTFGEEM